MGYKQSNGERLQGRSWDGVIQVEPVREKGGSDLLGRTNEGTRDIEHARTGERVAVDGQRFICKEVQRVLGNHFLTLS